MQDCYTDEAIAMALQEQFNKENDMENERKTKVILDCYKEISSTAEVDKESVFTEHVQNSHPVFTRQVVQVE